MRTNRIQKAKRINIAKIILSVVLLAMGLYVLGFWAVGSHGHIRFRPWMREDWVMLSLLLITLAIPAAWLIHWFVTFDRRKNKPIPVKQTYEDRISKLLLLFDKNIAAVRHIQRIKSLNYTKDNLAKARLLIYGKEFKELPGLKDEHRERHFEDLTILTFDDQNGIKYFALIYDNDELWTDPQVLEVIRV